MADVRGAEAGSSRRSKRSLELGTLAFVSALTLLRLAFAWRADLELFGDEAQYWVWSREPAWGYFSKPPLLAWLIHLTTSAFGHSEFAIRLASPLVHAATALVLGATARRLHGDRAGFWAAALYASLPAVSLSSLLISTDVPLLFCWSVALYAWTRMREERAAWLTITLGLAVGLGLLAKYAMVYFWLCVPLSLWWSRPNRPALGRDALVAMTLSVALIAPNLAWNAAHQFVTFQHTAVNAGVATARFRSGPALEFVLAQAGVLGPVLAAVWVRHLLRGRLGFSGRRQASDDRALLPFALIPLLVVLPVAFWRRANANWAAAMLPAICVQCAGLVALPRVRRWLNIAVASSLALALLLLGAVPVAEALGSPLPGRFDPWRRLRGGRELAREVARELDALPGAGLVSNDRMALAELAYYLGPEREHPWSWDPDGVVRHHFDLVWPLTAPTARPFVFVARYDAEAELARAWASVERRPDIEVAVAHGLSDTYHVYHVRSAP